MRRFEAGAAASFPAAPAEPQGAAAAPRLTFWGEARLDNRAEIASALRAATQSSDEQLIVEAYAAWGTDCASRLLGDFAFTIHEPATGKTFCARDAAGVRPLYYSVSEGSARLTVGRAIETVLESPGVSGELDEAFLAAYLVDRAFSHPEATFFRSVRKLPPGHTLIHAGGSVSTSRFWPPEVLEPLTCSTDEEAAEALRALLVQAIRDRMRVGGRVGVHLSGGLDSSSIAAIAADEASRHGSAPPEALSWQPPPTPATAGLTEHRNIDLVSRRRGICVHYLPPRVEPLVDLLAGDGARRPASATLSNEYLVQQGAAERGITHILSGWGGDEIISSSGQGHLAALLSAGRWRELCAAIAARQGRGWTFLASEAIQPLLPAGLQSDTRRRRRNRRNSLISRQFLQAVVPLQPPPRPSVGAGARMLGSLAHHVTERIESWALHGAHHGITYSYPLLDRRILEFALAVRPAYFHRRGHSRWLMRQATAPWLPPEISWGPKEPDTVRMDALRRIRPQLWGAFQRRLARRPSPPLRAEYVDMPRLMALLSASERETGRPMGRPWRAVSILDFQGDR